MAWPPSTCAAATLGISEDDLIAALGAGTGMMIAAFAIFFGILLIVFGFRIRSWGNQMGRLASYGV